MKYVSPEDYREVVKVRSPRLSGDERHLSFLTIEPADDRSYDRSFRVIDAGDSSPITAYSDHPVTVPPEWNPQSPREFAFVTAGSGSQLLTGTTDGDPERRLEASGSIGELAWRPDGTAIAFTMRATADERARGIDIDPGEYERAEPDPRVVDRLVYRDDSTGYLRGRQRVYLYDMEDGTARCLSADGQDCFSPAWDDAGAIYWLQKGADDRTLGTEYDLIRCDPDRDERAGLTTTTSLEPVLAATGDGHLAYLCRPPDRPATRQVEIRTYRRRTGETRTVTAELDRTIAVRQPRPVQWGSDGQLYFLTPDRGRLVLRRTDGDQDSSIAVVLDGHDTYAFDVGESTIAYVGGDWHYPGDLFTKRSETVTRQTAVNEDYLDARAIAEPEELWFEGEDGVAVQGWVLHPPAFEADEEYPLVVQLHGGPHFMWSNNGVGRRWHELQLLAAAGFVVFWCNPRGSTGYGEAFAAAITDDWGGPDFRDVMAGTEQVSGRSYIDRDRVFVMGGSYGGYLAAWCLGHTDRFAAAVVGRGGHDRISYYGTAATGFKTSIEDEFDARPWRDHDRLWAKSPAAHVADISAPTLLVHGEEDYTVPISGSEILYRFLKRRGVPTRFVRYPREGHGFPWSGEPAHVVDRYSRILDWFDEHGART